MFSFKSSPPLGLTHTQKKKNSTITGQWLDDAGELAAGGDALAAHVSRQQVRLATRLDAHGAWHRPAIHVLIYILPIPLLVSHTDKFQLSPI